MQTKKWKISLFFIVLCVIAVAGLKAHEEWNIFGPHAVESRFLEGTTPQISCNIDGEIFTRTRILYCDGDPMYDYWITDPKSPKVKMTATFHGRGWVESYISGEIDGQSKGSSSYSSPSKVGNFVALVVPVGVNVHDYAFEDYFDASSNAVFKTYSWSGDGSIRLTPTYWHRRWTIGIKKDGLAVTGEWKDGTPVPYAPEGTKSGSWEVRLDESSVDYDRNGNPCGSTPPTDSGSTPPTDSGSGGGSQPPPTDNTPNCPDCTSDCSSPCSCTNSGTCGGTVVTPPPSPEPEPPTTVACGRSACTESVSSSKQHKSNPCAAGHTYWTCNPTVNVANWLNKHRVRTCRYNECGRSWQQCVTGTTPICNKPYRKQNGLKCWAIGL